MMKKLIMTAVALVSLSIASPLAAQNSAAPAPQTPVQNQCIVDPHFSDWDFWVGEWRVTDATGKIEAGHNTITKDQKNCMFHENWTDTQGNTGYSLNYYNPITKLWRQVWVSYGAGGYNIDYTGGLDAEGAMVLNGFITMYATQKTFPFRGTWRLLEDGIVQQKFEQQDSKGNWNIWFDGRYHPIEKSTGE